MTFSSDNKSAPPLGVQSRDMLSNKVWDTNLSIDNRDIQNSRKLIKDQQIQVSKHSFLASSMLDP